MTPSSKNAARNRSATEVVVIGGGPAGATAATLLADHGRRVQLFERDTFPRFHVGESLVPETYWVLKRLGMLPKLQASPFVRKQSVQFVNADGTQPAPFYFWDNKPHECSQTWQVVRSEFDQMLLDNAREHGVQVHEGVRVRDVRFAGDRAVGVRVQRGKESVDEVAAPVVIDASGQSGLLMNRLKLRLWDPVLNKGAIWSYWRGAFRDAGRDAGATVVLQTADRNGWFWYIPLHEDRVSVGLVAPFDELFSRHADRGQTFREEVDRSPAVKQRLAGAEQVSGYFATKDFSYRCKQVAGPGWVLIGDAFGFLDPLYSSGILLALQSGAMAADAVAAALADGDLSAARLGAWGEKFNRGIDRMRRLVCEYYAGFHFGRFVRTHPEIKSTLTDLLIGDLLEDRVDGIWPLMDAFAPPDRPPIPTWDQGLPADAVQDNEILLPTGDLP